mmetsp:Transcript_13696/g.43782  ORF Transcript_13696/g.43782 Transcript_13696/m.43782 type:complete len:237 (-) Transcript_13696:372-1082(-)
MHDGFQDVLSWRRGLHCAHCLERFLVFTSTKVVDDQVELRFWNHADKPWQHANSVVSIAEHHQIVLKQRVIVDVHSLFHQSLELRLGARSIEQAVVIGRLEVECHHAPRELLQVDVQDLQAHVVVVQLVVAHCNIHVQRSVIAILEQQSLVDVSRFLEVVPEVMHGSERELVALVCGQFRMVLHQRRLVASPLCDVEQQSRPQRVPLWPTKRVLERPVVLLHVVQAGCSKQVQHRH